jgi:hypothetical protein
MRLVLASAQAGAGPVAGWKIGNRSMPGDMEDSKIQALAVPENLVILPKMLAFVDELLR